VVRPKSAYVIGAIVVVCAMVTACADTAPKSAADHEWKRTIAPGSFGRLFNESGTLFAAGATESGAPALWASSDASKWRLLFADFQRAGSVSLLAFGKAGSVAIGRLNGEGIAIWRASPGSKWEYIRQIDDVTLHSLVTARDNYFAFGTNRFGAPMAYRSNDGSDWTPAALTFDPQPVAIRQVVAHQGHLYAVGDSGPEAGSVASVWRSDDGVSWILEYRNNAPSAASVALSTDDHLYVGGFNAQQPILWTNTDGSWKSDVLPLGGSAGSIAEMPGGVAVLSHPFEAPASAFSHYSNVHMTRDRATWTSVSLFEFTDEADRIGNQIIRWHNRLLLLSHSQTTEIWSTKWK